MCRIFFTYFNYSNGAGHTGTYIAISILLEQLRMEKNVDVFQTVRKIRSVRPEFIENEVRK